MHYTHLQAQKCCPFAGQVYRVATGMARRKKGLQRMKN